MTTRELLESLEKQLDSITSAISIIKQMENENSRVYKRAAIINHVRGLKRGPYKRKQKKYAPGTHWMQKPENRERVIAVAKAKWAKRKKKGWTAARHAKFSATMRAKKAKAKEK